MSSGSPKLCLLFFLLPIWCHLAFPLAQISSAGLVLAVARGCGGGSAPYCSFLWLAALRDVLQRVISFFSIPTSMVSTATIQSRSAKANTTAAARILALLGVRFAPNMIVSRPTAVRAVATTATTMLTSSGPLPSGGLFFGIVAGFYPQVQLCAKLGFHAG